MKRELLIRRNLGDEEKQGNSRGTINYKGPLRVKIKSVTIKNFDWKHTTANDCKHKTANKQKQT